jgi:uncharacterized protein YdeI (YjbR/CyaY-like superfamily)
VSRQVGTTALTIPADLRAALARAPSVAARFSSLSPSHRREYVDWIAEAKRTETREARIDKTLRMLAEKKSPKG